VLAALQPAERPVFQRPEAAITWRVRTSLVGADADIHPKCGDAYKICGLVDCMPGRNRHCYVAIGGEELLITAHSPARLVRPTGWTMPAMIDADLGYLCVRRRG
jgi:hypothetical protein